MAYESLTYINARNEKILFGIGSKYHVNVQKDVTGISDITNTIYSTSSMGQHGDTYAGNRIEPREIEIVGKIRDLDKDTQIRLRREALKILNPDIDGRLVYQYGDFMRTIGAKVKESPKFTHEELSQNFSICFLCLNPFWEEEKEAREEIASWIGTWEFPCDIEESDPEDMIFGYREESLIVPIYNAGHIATGMKIDFKALGSLSNPRILNINTREFIKVNFDMVAGDVITIDTSYGNKSVTLTRNGVATNIYRYLDADSTFMQMDVGDNVFRYEADTGDTNLEVVIYFTQKYLGV